ncbi:trypsin [Lactobacillus iners LactinV 01V1-a]|uniref:Trypsin n=1 Tax=Lactobacillus iners LactinV 01V1-a TaxID=879297 RepID=E1NS64_9LACO|nr:trypsin [Lactobacillus iners LactinV 01V1-a]
MADSDQLQVILSDGRKIAAQKVGTDPETDLAVLKVNSKYINQVAKFASSKNLVPGQPVIAVGSPLGSQYATSVTQGIISAKSRVVNVVNEQGQVTNEATVIQTDAAINPGNSGGPLVNEQGQVIGINSMKLSRSGDGTAIEGMGFAIPSDEVVNILNQLVKNGKIVRPKLGIRVLDVTDLTRKDKKRIHLPNNIQEGVAVFFS